MLASASVAAAQGELVIEIPLGIEGAQSIAIVPFGSASPPPTDVAQVIASDLARSGLFAPLPQADLPSRPQQASDVNFRDWRLLGTPNLVIGRVESPAAGRYLVQFRLFDVFKAEQTLGFQFEGAEADLRRIAHQVSDILYEHLTGTPGAFNTRIAYITETRAADGSPRYALSVADSDGFNAKAVLESRQPIVSPAWSPDGSHLAYVSFEGRQQQIFVQDLSTGGRERVSSFYGLNGAPAWSPDGTQLALTLSKDGNPEIYVLTVGTTRLRRLTKNVGIDTEPAWAPDGQSLVFTSDRSGKPQIYQIPALGGRAERLTFEGTYNARASFSPDGTKLVLVHGNQGAYRIALLDLENKALLVLTDAMLDESPTFAPNGSMILYATTGAGGAALAAVSIDGRVRQRLAVHEGGVREPAWSPHRKTE